MMRSAAGEIRTTYEKINALNDKMQAGDNDKQFYGNLDLLYSSLNELDQNNIVNINDGVNVSMNNEAYKILKSNVEAGIKSCENYLQRVNKDIFENNQGGRR